MEYPVAEIFTSIQGEGVYAGALMTFIRLVGCSVGKKVCQKCDTDFDKTYPWRGGGEFSPEQLLKRVQADRVCITGGEPFDHDLRPLLYGLRSKAIHIETSGTKDFSFLERHDVFNGRRGIRRYSFEGQDVNQPIWITVCPKPGYLRSNMSNADEIKVIAGGLGVGHDWPTVDDARSWTGLCPVFIQPCNEKEKVNMYNLQMATDIVKSYPELRLSVQLHKLLVVR